MTTNESLFFRDGRPFEHFSRSMLPCLLARRGAERRLRIWSAAAATGQEAYSLAICVEELNPCPRDWTIEILGTDISEQALERARQGVYTQFEAQRGLSTQRLVKWFTQEPNGWRVKGQVARHVRFARHNLLADGRTHGVFDVIFVRNVLIYFDLETKRRVIANLARAIAGDGFLVLGGTETLLGVSDLFTAEPEERGIYRPSAFRRSPLGPPDDGAGRR